MVFDKRHVGIGLLGIRMGYRSDEDSAIAGVRRAQTSA
ncbi:hypothetical protein Salmuc_04686 [Salipiger mucosus DSM 16094]|uniref:Uncharacterized protein n=1 Tax=Salipiger mucosus DSM 16094 TaxID=1123237 RepID=S9RFB1_9RHOB|nr:hypothetical protein Salmuc_04686 [Salipiger mucosus DSM 16094]